MDQICKIHRKFSQADYVDREVEFMDLVTLEARHQGKKSIDSVFYGKLSGGVDPVLFRLIMMRMEVYSMFYTVWSVLMIKRSEKTNYYI